MLQFWLSRGAKLLRSAQGQVARCLQCTPAVSDHPIEKTHRVQCPGRCARSIEKPPVCETCAPQRGLLFQNDTVQHCEVLWDLKSCKVQSSQNPKCVILR